MPDKIDAHEFSIRWAGSLLAAETGQYEFTVHTDHAARLWMNDNHHPLIDAWVKSGNDTDYRARSSWSAAGLIPCGWSSAKASRASMTRRRKRKKAAAGEGLDRAEMEAAAGG